MAKAGFPAKAEFLDLPGFEKARDDADSFRSPTARRWPCGANGKRTLRKRALGA
jgi:hypothetical protein